MVPRAPSGGRDPTPSPQPSFPRSVQPDQQESLGSAESHFASGVPCLLTKGKKETKKKKALKPGMEISSEQSHQADSHGELTETKTIRLLPCAETGELWEISLLCSIMNLVRKPGKPALWSQGLEEAKAGAGSLEHLPKETRAAGGESVTWGSHPHLRQEAGREAAGPRGAAEQGQPWGPGCSAGLPFSVWGEHEVGGDWGLGSQRALCGGDRGAPPTTGTFSLRGSPPYRREPAQRGLPQLTEISRG